MAIRFPLIADGDADKDGFVNRFEYGSGSDALGAKNKPSMELTREDLTGVGFTDDERVYSFTLKSDANDASFAPSTSPGLVLWSLVALQFLDVTELGDLTHRLCFHLTNQDDSKRFFRLEKE